MAEKRLFIGLQFEPRLAQELEPWIKKIKKTRVKEQRISKQVINVRVSKEVALWTAKTLNKLQTEVDNKVLTEADNKDSKEETREWKMIPKEVEVLKTLVAAAVSVQVAVAKAEIHYKPRF